MKYLVIFVIGLVIIAAGYYSKQASIVENNDATSPNSMESVKKPPELDTHTHNHHNSASSNTAQKASTGKTGNPHFDQMSPEMQQALKDSLLLEGPMETITHPDGSIELPSNGRFTQMPVAVEMPDGSIEIREYSEIPKAQ